jgi:NAD+ synthase
VTFTERATPQALKRDAVARRAVLPQIPITLRVAVDAAEAEHVIVRFLKDYLASSGREGYVVGLSGGIDSAVAAALAARAVGAERVHPLVLPEATTEAAHLEDAALVAKALGLQTQTLSIQPLVDAFQAAYPKPDRTQLANAKARFRMILLHAESFRRRALVLGTGNKSELLVGYFSKYGDGGVDLQPIGDLYKTQVRELARHLRLPERVMTKPPTAGLWAGQTDEDELGIDYARLDRVLLGLEIKLPVDTIAQVVGVAADEVRRIDEMRVRSQHKRRTPLIPKIGLRSVGVDWRTPTWEG